ncbi:MAG: selenocysteine-specific translation elongation factor [Candidatus Zixiibacteriota bacterium]|nr:MAG: selenocysteine-specific translation elongation factor [candidate division Zixibacteria bacterium]
MIVIGTAGHIDHGKSSIVKRLTGTDPDRLPEEQTRGMTIDLGFAFYQTPDSDTIAFVDVPGHERFVKNMVAGVGAIDAVMLVVAADDGWMPQSEEHFQIVRLLGVRRGFIVINKADLAEPDWLALLRDEIREKTTRTFLADAPVFTVSAETGAGFDELTAHLDTLTSVIEPRRDIGKARLYNDRSFVRPGIGGVVTGTLRGGSLSVGQSVSVWPSLRTAKIRSLHSNNRDVVTAVPGQRTAVSFTGLDKELLVRGGVVSARSDLAIFRENPILALSVELLGDAAVSITDRRRVLIILGTTETEGEIRLYHSREIKPGERGVAFFKPDRPLYGLVADHFILRLPTPMVTIGGGRLLDHLPYLPRKKNLEHYRYLEMRCPPTLANLVVSELHKQPIVSLKHLLVESDFSAADIEAAVKKAWRDKTFGLFEGCVYHVRYLAEAAQRFEKKLTAYLEEHSHLTGLSLEQIARVTGYPASQAALIVRYLVSEGVMQKVKDQYSFAGRGLALKGPIKAAHDDIIAALTENRFDPPTLSSLAARGKIHKDAIKVILDTGRGYKCGSDFIFSSEAWQEIIAFIKEKISRDNKLIVADLRDKFGISRKFCIPILEETDRIRLTRRDGDIRVKGESFES